MTYIGQREIKSIDGTTVTFTDDSLHTYTPKQMTYMVTEDPKSLTEQQNIMLENILPELQKVYRENDLSNTPGIAMGIFEVLEDHDIRKGDWNRIQSDLVAYWNQIWASVGRSFDEAMSTAMGKAFGTFQENTPFENFQENIRISDIRRVKAL